jgi:hypothetical protein
MSAAHRTAGSSPGPGTVRPSCVIVAFGSERAKPFLYLANIACMAIGAAPSASARATATQVPIVQLAYADGFDAVSSQQTHYAIRPEWVAEVNARPPEFIANWRRDGGRLRRATEQVLGKPFRDQQFMVALSVCSFPSMRLAVV